MSKFDSLWRSLERTVADGWCPGLAAGVRHAGEVEYFATGVHAFGSAKRIEPTTPFRIASLSKPVAGAIAASMIGDGVFGLDDPVERWLPELATPRVLVRPDGPLDQTVPARTPITVRHLLTGTNGLGVIFGQTPLSVAIQAAGVGPGAIPPSMSADEFMSRVGALPLAYQPGERWMYHMPADILSVLIARAAGRPLHDVVEQRITRLLGMKSTGFWVTPSLAPTGYIPGADGLAPFDEFAASFAEPPQFETLSGGLVSTIPDYLTFLAALADGTLPPPELKTQMTSDQLSAEQRAGMIEMAGPSLSWGFQVSVQTAAGEPWTAPGRYGWTGGSGTSAYVDPSRDVIGAVFTQRFMAGPGETFAYFWEPLAAALES